MSAVNEDTISLPYDIVHQVVQYMNIGYINITLVAIGRNLTQKDKNKIRSTRLDPIKYLSKLTNKPLALLSLMRNTKTILSGLRALEYFVPGSCTKNTRWEFYCENKHMSIMLFISYLSLLGATFSPLIDVDIAKGVRFFNKLLGRITTNNRIYNIEVKWKNGECASYSLLSVD